MKTCHRQFYSVCIWVASALLFYGWGIRQACAFPQNREPESLPQIVKLIEQGKLQAAEAELKLALRSDPNSSTIYRVLGFVYQRQHRLPEAEHALEESLRLSPANNPQAMFLLAQTKFALKKNKEAVALARQLSSLAPDDPHIHYALGRMLRENGQVSEGVGELEKAHALAAQDPATTTELIIGYQQQRDSAKLAPLLESFFGTAPYSDLVQAGSRMAEAGELGLAVSVFQRATDLQPDRYDGKFDLALALFRVGRYPEALKILDQIPAAQSEQQPDYHYLRAKVELALEDPKAAGEEYALALRQQPDNESLCVDAGLLYSRFEDFWKALGVFEACVQKLPDSVPIETGLGLTYFRLGKYPAAIAAFRKVLDLRPEADAAREALGFLLYITSSFSDARQVLEPRLANREVDYYLPFLHALVLLRLDARENRLPALHSLEQSIKLNPKFAPAYFQRGKLLWEMGEATRALADLDLATKLDPEYAQPYYLRAQIYFKQGKKDEAEQTLQKSAALNREREETEQKRDLANRLFQALQ
jgi:tetratricopeptide (TPR) repeat protein